MTQILADADSQGLVFEIVSARISDAADERKHVIYTLQVRHISGSDDLSPSVIERRYTHFLALHTALKQEQPQLMANVAFPKKVLVGNFDNELISARSTGFEALLRGIAAESQLRASRALVDFFQDAELQKARAMLATDDFGYCLPILENSFKLLNKVFMDRSPAVLLALCRLLACAARLADPKSALKWAELALHRFDGVSDSDLLALYVPLLKTCALVFTANERDAAVLQERIQDLGRRGVNIAGDNSLLKQVELVHAKIFN